MPLIQISGVPPMAVQRKARAKAQPGKVRLKIDSESATPAFQQFVDQLHFRITAGELAPGSKLPSIRALATTHELATNTVAKALRQLEFRGLITAHDRSGYVVATAAGTGEAGSRY